MRITIFSLALSFLLFMACQPQTESREHMDLTSKRMSDSIMKLLDTGFTQPARNLVGTGSPIASAASSFTSSEPSK